MKLFSAFSAVALFGSYCVAQEQADLSKRASTCSIGIGRVFGSISWDVTVYNVAQTQRQDVNIMNILKNAEMDKGQSISITLPPHTINITNVDNAPVFTYDVEQLQAPFTDYEVGLTKTKLSFAIPDAKMSWDTDACTPQSVVYSAGREGWSCDFACP